MGLYFILRAYMYVCIYILHLDVHRCGTVLSTRSSTGQPMLQRTEAMPTYADMNGREFVKKEKGT